MFAFVRGSRGLREKGAREHRAARTRDSEVPKCPAAEVASTRGPARERVLVRVLGPVWRPVRAVFANLS
ncbi:hypothetical protein GCM10009854_32880 [Saccharopolyspora halophila]|uniref:Uncharacterized protein n=1 Tax=Saccharopolyspora halophila TaxID=405551 RepID=A0ABN3GIH0_9PSEU